MHYEQDECNHEEHIGDIGRDSSNAGHAEHTGNQRHNEKHQRIMEHNYLLARAPLLSGAFSSKEPAETVPASIAEHSRHLAWPVADFSIAMRNVHTGHDQSTSSTLELRSKANVRIHRDKMSSVEACPNQ
jgi:hypothetical protein